MNKLPSYVRVLCSGWLLLQGCQGTADGSNPPDAGSAAAARARHVVATGRVEGWREANVTSKLPGRILHFDYSEGDEVDADAPVVRLEDRDLQARVREAAARANEAALDLRRVRALKAKAVVSSSELEHAEAAARTSTAALDEARVVLDYATIKAPFRGTLLRKFKEVGEGVGTNGPPDPVFRIADLSRLKVKAEVPEGDIAAVQPGGSADVVADAYPGERLASIVSRVGLAVGRKRLRSDDPRERLDEKVVEVELTLNADPRLRSGMSVDVVFAPPAPDS